MQLIQVHGGLKIVLYLCFFTIVDDTLLIIVCVAEITLRAVCVVYQTRFCLGVKRSQTVNGNRAV